MRAIWLLGFASLFFIAAAIGVVKFIQAVAGADLIASLVFGFVWLVAGGAAWFWFIEAGR